MTNIVLQNNQEPELLSSIHSIALFPISETIFQIVNEKPEWLGVLGRCNNKQQVILDQPEGFLENFLLDAKQFWLSNQKGLLHSGKWIQTNAQGIDYPFEALASIFKGKPLLIVQKVSESYLHIRRILQSAREDAISREKLEHLVFRDYLTTLYNRRGFFLHAEQNLLIARRKQQAVTIACIDLDRLKWVNDEYGHLAGDQNIINAANLFKHVFRQMDILGRVGGDEFLALMINMDSDKITKFYKRLDDAIKNWNKENGEQLQLSFSIGLASDNGENISMEKLIKKADENMYSDKKNKYDRQCRT